jgi:tetratricopeptide (TPR) repeat protein
MRIRTMIALVAFAGAPGLGWAEDAQALREQAEAAYRKALAEKDPARARAGFRTAAARYNELIDAGHETGRLYYNLASAYLGAGDVGRAVLNYRRAAKLRPDDDRVEAGLEQALKKVEGAPAPHAPWLGAWTHFVLGAGLYLAAFLLFVCWRRFGKRRWAVAAGVCLVLGLWGLGSLGWQLISDGSRPAGVVCAEGVVLRQGNGPSFAAVREEPLPPGCEFRVVRWLGKWQQVVLSDGTVGWIPEQPLV